MSDAIKTESPIEEDFLAALQAISDGRLPQRPGAHRRREANSSSAEGKGSQAMTTKTVGKVKLKTDAKGKTKLERVHTYDASKARKIAKAKTKRVVAPARAAARGR